MNKQEIVEMMVDVINDLHYKVGEMQNIEESKIDEIVNFQREFCIGDGERHFY